MESKSIKRKKSLSQSDMSLLDEIIAQQYYRDKISLSSKELDKEFDADIRTLASSMKNLSELERRFFIELLSRRIESYITDMVDKKIENLLVDII